MDPDGPYFFSVLPVDQKNNLVLPYRTNLLKIKDKFLNKFRKPSFWRIFGSKWRGHGTPKVLSATIVGGSDFSSYETESRKMTSHFELLTQKLLLKFFFRVTKSTS